MRFLNLSALRQRLPALQSRDFLIFWLGQFVSLIGTWMQSTTLPYLAYRLSGRPFDLGLIGFANTLPTLFLAIPAGVFIERLDKRKIVLLMQTLMMLLAFLLASLALSGHIQMWHILTIAFSLGILNAIEITARQAMLIELVGRQALPNAIALQSTIFNAARVLGPSLAAPFLVFIKNGGEGWAFFANGVSFLFVILGLFFVRTRPVVRPEGQNQQGFWKELLEGLGYIAQTPAIGLLILMATIVGFFGFPLVQQIPVIARDILAQAGDTEAAVATRNSLLYTFQGVGALLAALLLSIFNPLRKGCLLVAGQSALIFGILALSIVRQAPLAYTLLLVIGWGMVTQLATMNTLLQLLVDDTLRGRVFSVYLWALQGIAPLGSLTIGAITQAWGLPTAALVSGLICVVLLGGLHLARPSIHQTVA